VTNLTPTIGTEVSGIQLSSLSAAGKDEQQPPGTTFLYILDKPETGGDTLFVDAVEAYNRLSPAFRERPHGLKARHLAHEQSNYSLAPGGISRREPVINEHPIVRTHPATGEKAIYVNPQCEHLPSPTLTAKPD